MVRPVRGGSAVELLHRGTFGSEASRLAAGVFDLMREGGFRADHLEVCFAALFTYVTGHVDPRGTGVTAGPTSSSDRSACSRTSDEMFAFGLEALIEGLKLRREPRSPNSNDDTRLLPG